MLEMDMRQQIGASLPLQHSLQLSSNSSLIDDFFNFDSNPNFTLMDIENFDIDLPLNLPEFTSLLDCNAANTSDTNFGPPSLVSFPQSSGEFVPADEGSGTTNTTPDFSASHPHQCLETSSSQHRMVGQAEILHSAQEPVVSNQWHDVEEANKQFDGQASRGIMHSQTVLQEASQCLSYNVNDSLSEPQEAQGGIQKFKKYVHRNQPAMMALEEGPSQVQSSVPRKMSTQEQISPGALPPAFLDSAERHRGSGYPVVEEKQEPGVHSDLHNRLISGKVPGHQLRQPERQCIGYPGTESSNAGVGLNKRIRVPELSNVSGSGSLHQAGVAGELRGSNLINGAIVQSQAANQLSGLLIPTSNCQQSPGSVNLLNHQSLAQAQTANASLPSELQLAHQQHVTNLVEEHVNAKFSAKLPPQDHIHAHAANDQSRCQQDLSDQSGYLPVRQLQTAPLQPIGHSSPHLAFQLLRSDSFGGNRNGNNFVPGVQQSFPQIQQRLRSQQLQGMNIEGRHSSQHIPMGGQSHSGRPADSAMRHPESQGLAMKCEQLIQQYIQEKSRRPSDNNILFWRDLVQKFFMQGAVKRCCLTSYNASAIGRHAQGLFPMDYWFCNLCGVEPGRGFESSTDVLPRLLKINYDSGLMEEFLYLDMAEEGYVLNSSKIVLEYSKAVHESIFSELRVIRHGRLRVTFSPSLKIYSWEFCTKTHEEFVPRKNMLQQVLQLANLANKVDQDGHDNNGESFKSSCDAFTVAARNFAVKLDAPTVNDLGFSKRFVRCLQIAEVVNSMKDLVSFEKKTGLGPIGSLASFPSARRAKLDQANSESSLKPIHHMPNQWTNDFPEACRPSPQTSNLTRVSGEKLNHLQAQTVQSQGSNVLHDYETFPGLSQASGQVQPHVRSQIEARLSNLIRPQTYGVMQPPAPSQVPSNTPAQSYSVHHAGSELVGGQMSPAFSQLTCEPSILQGYNQQYRQIYNKTPQHFQQHNKASSQLHTLSHSVNPIGQHSLPGAAPSRT